MLTNPRDAFIGHSRSPSIVPFHMLDIVSYCAIVTLSLRHAVFTIFDFKNVVTLKIGSEVTHAPPIRPRLMALYKCALID